MALIKKKGRSMKRMISLLLACMILFSISPTAIAASDEAIEAAHTLYELGLFNGTGIDENGNPIFELDRVPTRYEAVTMLIRLMALESEVKIC